MTSYTDLEIRLINFALNSVHSTVRDMYNSNIVPVSQTADQKELITIMSMFAKDALKSLPAGSTEQEKLSNLLHNHILDTTIATQSIPVIPGSDSAVLISHIIERALLDKIENWGQH